MPLRPLSSAASACNSAAGPRSAITSSWVPAAGTGLTWTQTLDAVRAAGNQAGRNAADQWCRMAIGKDATGSPKPIARNALRDIADEDPEMIFGLPLYDRAGSNLKEPPTDTDLVTALRHASRRDTAIHDRLQRLVQ